MNNLIFHQLFEKETSSYTYLLADKTTKEAIIIDPVVDMADRDEKLIKELGLKLLYVLDTHVHADHVTASGELRKRTGAKVALSSAYKVDCPDILLNEGDTIKFGEHEIKTISTPGHTAGCMSFILGDRVFTGDALLIRGCGRTDFQEGSASTLYASVKNKILELPMETTIYPAHDYKGLTRSSVALERAYNPRLKDGVSESEFISIMDNLNLAYPKRIQEAVPANRLCGMPVMSEFMESGFVDGSPTVTPEELSKKLGHVKVVDVRAPEEFNGELGHVPASELHTLGPELERALEVLDSSQEIVFVCKVGARSAAATEVALKHGLQKVYNLYGGMVRWNELGLPVEKDRGGS